MELYLRLAQSYTLSYKMKKKVKMSRYIVTVTFFLIWGASYGQNLHYFFIDDVYQRSYFNPALHDNHTVSISTGLGLDFFTNGPSLSDITNENPSGGLIISAEDAIASMGDVNDLFGYTSLNTLDISVNTPLFRVSAGHAWKAQAWLEYPKDLAEFITYGNGPYVGETLSISPQIDYLNYHEVYLGFQKDFGPWSVGVRFKRLSGLQTVRTENAQIDLTTSDDIYQIRLDTDFEIRSSSALVYNDIDDFDLDVENISFDNFLSNNAGWAIDLGASLKVSDALELSLGMIDIGGIEWDVNPKIYTSKKVQTFDGIDVSEYITSDDEFVILDSIEVLLDLEETNEAFSTTLPMKIFLGCTFELNDMWTFGGLIQSNGSGDRRSNVLALNATARVFKFLSVGGMYSIKQGNPANIGLFGSFYMGPVVAFLSMDNVVKVGSFDSKNANARFGLTVQI